MSAWIEVYEQLGTKIPRTYQQGLDLGSAVKERLLSSEVSLSWLMIKWVTVDFVCGFNAALESKMGVSFHYMSSQVATMLGGQSEGIENARRSVSGIRKAPHDTRNDLGGSGREVDITGG
jgi:hypothetical protein